MEVEGKYSYAGIGARSTPDSILTVITKIAQYLSEHNWALRSGGAMGADGAFAKGACGLYSSNKLRKLITTYKGDTCAASLSEEQLEMLREIARKHNNGFDKKTEFVQSLLLRNVQIILGYFGNNPVRLVVCWTPGAQAVGGTGMGIRIANTYGIKVHNLADSETLKHVCTKVGAVML